MANLHRFTSAARGVAIFLAATSAAVLAFSGAFTASAQSTSTAATPPVTFVDAQKTGEINVGALIGMPVVNDKAETVGNINYVLIDAKGQATTVTVGVGGFLGIGEKNVGVSFSSLNFADVTDGRRLVKLQVTKDQLLAAPKYQWLETPLAVRVEETIKNTADKIKSTAKDVGDKASETMDKAKDAAK